MRAAKVRSFVHSALSVNLLPGQPKELDNNINFFLTRINASIFFCLALFSNYSIRIWSSGKTSNCFIGNNNSSSIFFPQILFGRAENAQNQIIPKMRRGEKKKIRRRMRKGMQPEGRRKKTENCGRTEFLVNKRLSQRTRKSFEANRKTLGRQAGFAPAVGPPGS